MDNRKKTKLGIAVGVVVVLILLFAFMSPVAMVPAGHTGVLTTFGKVEERILSEGMNFKSPFQKVTLIDNRVQRQEFQLQAFSSDIQQTDVIGSVNFTVDKSQSQHLYQTVGVSYYDTVIYPRILENVKLVFSKYTAEGLIENRTQLSRSIDELVSQDMAAYGINIESINIENIDFSDVFTDAVEAKQVAQQKKLTTETEQETALIIAQTEADKKVIEAEANAKTNKIEADAKAYAVQVAAEAEAEANAKLAASLTDNLLLYNQVMRWNGTVPQFMLGEGGSVLPIIDMQNGMNGTAPATQTPAPVATPAPTDDGTAE